MQKFYLNLNNLLFKLMSEIYIREELDKIKTSHLLSYISSSAGPKKKQIYLNEMYY